MGGLNQEILIFFMIFSFLFSPLSGEAKVKVGLEKLIENHLDLIKGKRLGIIANQTSLDSNYKRDMWYDETGFPWTATSPNMPTLETAIIYPGMCLMEKNYAKKEILSFLMCIFYYCSNNFTFDSRLSKS